MGCSECSSHLEVDGVMYCGGTGGPDGVVADSMSWSSMYNSYANTGFKVCVANYKRGVPIGEGASWSPDRREAWRVFNGKRIERISLKEAALIAEGLETPVPPKDPDPPRM